MGHPVVNKKTFKQVREFNMAAGGFLQRKPENVQTKLGYAIQKLSQGVITTILKEYQSEYQEKYYDMVQRKMIDLALTDKDTGAVLTAPKGSDRPYLYDKVGLNAIIKAERDFNKYWEDTGLAEWDAKEFEIEPHYAAEMPKEPLTDNEKEAFNGFVTPSNPNSLK